MADIRTRRHFLKTAALGGAGAVFCAGTLDVVSPLLWQRRLAIEPNLGYWARVQPPQNPKLAKDDVVDVAVIGGGLTGLSSAYYICCASPGKTVAVLEAISCGNGASGRNGAMVLTMTADRYASFSSDPAMDKDIYELTAGNIRSLAKLSASAGIDCELEINGALQVFDNGTDSQSVSRYVKQARSLGMPVELWDAHRTAAAIGSDAYQGAFFDPNGGHVHPMKLVQVFKVAAQAAGATIYENTVVEHIQEGREHVLYTQDGHTLRAKSLVLASNAFTSNLGYLKNSILPLREYVAITRPLGNPELVDIGWQLRAPFNDSNTETYYFGLTKDNRIHIGGGPPRYNFNNSRDAARDAGSAYALLQQELVRVYPALAGIGFEMRWDGIVDWSLDASPSVGYTGKYGNIFYGLGYSGHGVNLSSVFGRIISDLEAGRKGAWARYPFFNAHIYYVPNEPFRWLAAGAGVAWYELSDPH